MVIIVFGAIAIGVAFRSLLIDQAKAAITLTSNEVATVAESTNALGLYSPGDVLASITSSAQLDHWASTSEYVQIDDAQGHPIGKSSNLVDLLPALPATDPGNRRFTELTLKSGHHLLVLDRRLGEAKQDHYVVHVAERLDIVDEETLRARTILLIVALLSIIAVVVASFFIAQTAIDPIKRLTAAMAQIGSERLDRRLRWKRRDEVGTLAATFDAMLDRLQDAFARERQFISDASHELKTPLTVINANAQLLQRWGDRDQEVRRDSIGAIIDESGALASMVSGMLTLAKADSGDQIPREPLALEPLVADAVAHLHDRAASKGLALEAHVRLADVTIVVGDAGLLRQMISNLVDNAIKFTEAGRIDVTVERTGGSARIVVADSGVGIAPETAERLFDRFFRGDESHSRIVEGTGLGLAIVRSIARVHGGTVTARPRAEGGSEFVVELPAIEPTLTESQ